MARVFWDCVKLIMGCFNGFQPAGMNPEMLGGVLVNLSAGHCLWPGAGSEGQLLDPPGSWAGTVQDSGCLRCGLLIFCVWKSGITVGLKTFYFLCV